MTDDYADLRALAEAALAEKAGNEGMLAEMRRKRQFLPRWIDDSRQAEYRTAANPARILALLADLDAARARHPMTPDPLDFEAALPLNSWCGYDIECAWGLGCDAHRLRAEVERLRAVAPGGVR